MFARIEAVSAFYESAAAEGAAGPAFLNVAAGLSVSDDREVLVHRLGEVEREIGRTSIQRLEARPIDIDLLAFDAWERPQLSQRPFNIVPLAEIVPEYAARAQRGDGASMRRLEHGLRFHVDRQQEIPDVRIALGRAGVSRVRRLLLLEIDGKTKIASGEFSMVADLASHRSGLHMSRFVETLEESVLDVLSQEQRPTRIDRLVETIAQGIVSAQRATRADVRLDAEFSLERWTPVSGRRGEETYTAIGIAHADGTNVRSSVGIEAEGMTTCPCAQDMVREHSLRQLVDSGFTTEDAQRVLDVLPGATHNQRGRGVLILGADRTTLDAVRIEDLIEIVESSMSSETYDLLKRPDEFFVVNKAHRHPKFVEDVVRGIIARSLETYAPFPDEAFIFAAQRNEESIHKHDAFAETYGTFKDFRDELAGGEVTARIDLAAWLSGI
jgi:GTP cyclohydrolase-4